MNTDITKSQILRVLNNMINTGEVKTKKIKGVRHYMLTPKEEVTRKNKERKVSAKWRKAGLKSWVTRRKNIAKIVAAEAKNKDMSTIYSARAKKAWETRRQQASWANQTKVTKKALLKASFAK